MPLDLEFAGMQTILKLKDLAAWRKRCTDALNELAWRCAPLTQALLKWQPDSVKAIAGSIHVGLIAVLVILARWPDKLLPQRFVSGFGIVGVLEKNRRV